jgi:hypothetical protein
LHFNEGSIIRPFIAEKEISASRDKVAEFFHNQAISYYIYLLTQEVTGEAKI